MMNHTVCLFFFQAEDGIRDGHVTGVQTCALPIFFYMASRGVTKDEAIRMVVLGTAEVVTRRIHVEYAVEIDRLIELELGEIGRASCRERVKRWGVRVSGAWRVWCGGVQL